MHRMKVKVRQDGRRSYREGSVKVTIGCEKAVNMRRYALLSATCMMT